MIYQNVHSTPLGTGSYKIQIGDTIDTDRISNPTFMSAVDSWAARGFLKKVEVPEVLPEILEVPMEILEETPEAPSEAPPEVPLKKTRKKRTSKSSW